MKAFRFLFMLMLIIGFSTGLQATIPDLKENSKTEKMKTISSDKMVKAEFQLKSVVEKSTDLDFAEIYLVPSIDSDFIKDENLQVKKESAATTERLFRKARDGFIQ